jgi:hypothetical protein
MSTNPTILAMQTQLDCYRRLCKLAELQHEHVQQNQTEGLLEVLQSRQSVLEEIATIEPQLAQVRVSWTEFLDALSADERAIAESIVAESKVLLERIVDSDKNDALVLQQRKLNLTREINQTQSARQVNRTYAASAYAQKSTKMDVSR